MIDPPVGLPIAVGRPVVVTNGTAATSHPQQQQQQYTPSQSPHRHHHQTHRHAATATGAATAAADGDHEEDARGHGRGGDRRRSSASAADDAGRRHAPRGPPLSVIGEIRGLGFELGPWLIVAFMLMLAHVADSVPSAATATETPWLAPALCEAAPNRWVSFSAADASAAPASSSSTTTTTTTIADGAGRGEQGADANIKRAAGDITAAPTACYPAAPMGSDASAAAAPMMQRFVLPSGMQGWPSLPGSNLTLAIYHDDYDLRVSILSLTLRDARGRTLLTEEDVITFVGGPPRAADQHEEEEEDDDSATRRGLLGEHGDSAARRGDEGPRRHRRARVRATTVLVTPGRILKGGGGGGHHGHHHHYRGRTHGGRHDVRRPATSLTRYVATPSVRTAHGRHWRGAIAAGAIVFSVHHTHTHSGTDTRATGHCQDYTRGGCSERVRTELSRDVITSAGVFSSGGAAGGGAPHAADIHFPLTFEVMLEIVRPPVDEQWPRGAPTIFFTLYSPDGAAGVGDGSAESLRQAVWLPLFFSVFALLQRLMPGRAQTPDGLVLLIFVALCICGSGYQVQLWMGGAWARGEGELTGANGM